MKVQNKYVINGKVVELKAEFSGITVYEEGGDDEMNLYFVKGNEVVQTLKIGADCGQNMGYISKCDFSNGYA